jgi:hypothetical protein
MVVVSTSTFYARCQPLVARTLATLEEAMEGASPGSSGRCRVRVILSSADILYRVGKPPASTLSPHRMRAAHPRSCYIPCHGFSYTSPVRGPGRAAVPCDRLAPAPLGAVRRARTRCAIHSAAGQDAQTISCA